MEEHFMISDEEFEMQFANSELKPALFSHEAHLRLAWIHIRKYGVKAAIDNIDRQLRDFVALLGAKDKYNKTLTVAAIMVVSHFMKKVPADNFGDFIEQNPRLKYNFRELIASHYAGDIFNSALARNEYQEPDLLPFT